MTSASPKPLPEAYHDWLVATVDEKGFETPFGMVIGTDGRMTVLALAVPPAEAYKVVLATMQEVGVNEAIFALDRFTKPGQGTTLRDVMAGHYLAEGTARPFIVEYQHAPRIVKPIDWHNTFWNRALMGELRQVIGSVLLESAS